MKTINHECYVSLEVAKLLKEAGFDWECRGIYVLDSENDPEYVFSTANFTNTSKEIKGYIRLSAPTLDVAQRWLREEKGYSIYPTYGGYKIYVLDINDSAGFSRTYGLNSNLTYEEAQEAGIKKALELILEEGE